MGERPVALPKERSRGSSDELRAAGAGLPRVAWDALGRRARSVEIQKPPVRTLTARGFAVSDYPDLERAGDWLNCSREECQNRAYLTVLYPDEDAAIEEIPARAAALVNGVLPRRPYDLTRDDPIAFYVWYVEAVNFIGRDYRGGGCIVPDSAQQLRWGRGEEPAWREIRRQRDREEVEGALLPSATPAGELFLFVESAFRIRTRDLVRVVPWRYGDRGG